MADARHYLMRMTKAINNYTVIHLGKICNFRSGNIMQIIQREWEDFVWPSV